jgi:hypothetical protein
MSRGEIVVEGNGVKEVAPQPQQQRHAAAAEGGAWAGEFAGQQAANGGWASEFAAAGGPAAEWANQFGAQQMAQRPGGQWAGEFASGGGAAASPAAGLYSC